MGCLLTIFHRKSIDKKRMALLQNSDDANDKSQNTYSIQNQYTNQEDDEQLKPYQNYTKIACLEKQVLYKIYLIQHNQSRNYYVLKTFKIDNLRYKGIQESILNELTTYKSCQGKFLIEYHTHIQTSKKIYIILEFIEGGTLRYLMKIQKFNETEIRFYAAEILLGLKVLHQNNIICRTLTPDNIYLDKEGHIKLCNFMHSSQGQECKVATGDIYYQAPEIAKITYQNQLSDLWSLGAIIYELLVGFPPYFHPNIQTYKRLKWNQKLKLPESLSENSKSILKLLLSSDCQARINSSGISEIYNHPFFQDLNWELLNEKSLKPPFVPELRSKSDLKYFLDKKHQDILKQQDH